MAARFWVTGGTGNWNSTTNWSATTGGASGASVPSTSDTATYDASSGAGTATLDISPTIQTLTMTGFTGTLAFGTNTISLNSTGTVFTGATTMTVTGTPQIILTNNSATARTITPTAVTEANSISFRITAGTGTLSINTGSVRNLDFTDGTNPTGYAGAAQNMIPTIYGNFKASTGMTKVAGTGTFTFAATSGTKTITTAAVVFDNPFTFNGVGGTFQLQDALTSGATRTCTLTNGTLDLASYTLTTGLFSSSNSNTRTLAFGTGKIVVTGVNVTIFNIGTSTNMTVSGTPLVEATGVGAGTRAVGMGQSFASPEANSVSLTVSAGADTISFTGAGGAFRNVSFVGFTGTLSILQTQVIYGNWNWGGVTVTTGTPSFTFSATSGTKTITSNSVAFSNSIIFNGVGGTWQLQDAMTLGSTSTTMLTNGTLDLASYTLTTGLFSSSNSNTRTLAFGTGKIVLTGTSGTLFTTSTATGLTVTGTAPLIQATAGGAGTRTITMGAAGESNAISLDVTAGSDIISLSTTSGSYKNVNFTGFTGTVSIQNSILVFGNWNYGGTTIQGTGTGTVNFSATSGTKTITSNGFSFPSNVNFNGIGGTFACQDALSVTSTLTITNGTLQLKSGTTNTVGSFTTVGTTQKFLQATTNGSQATLSQASGTVSASYLTIQDSNATGGAVFNSFTSNANVNSGNNTGWKFGSANSAGGFLQFF